MHDRDRRHQTRSNKVSVYSRLTFAVALAQHEVNFSSPVLDTFSGIYLAESPSQNLSYLSPLSHQLPSLNASSPFTPHSNVRRHARGNIYWSCLARRPRLLSVITNAMTARAPLLPWHKSAESPTIGDSEDVGGEGELDTNPPGCGDEICSLSMGLFSKPRRKSGLSGNDAWIVLTASGVSRPPAV